MVYELHIWGGIVQLLWVALFFSHFQKKIKRKTNNCLTTFLIRLQKEQFNFFAHLTALSTSCSQCFRNPSPCFVKRKAKRRKMKKKGSAGNRTRATRTLSEYFTTKLQSLTGKISHLVIQLGHSPPKNRDFSRNSKTIKFGSFLTTSWSFC